MKFLDGIPDYVIHWENYDRLYYEQDYEGMIRLQKDYLQHHTGNPRDELMLADAYGYAGKHKLALKILKRLHRFNPYDSEYVEALVECLKKCRINPRTFKWRRKVLFFEGREETVGWCYTWLEKKGEAEKLCDLYMEMWNIGYIGFDVAGLEEILGDDPRFELSESSLKDEVAITLNQWK